MSAGVRTELVIVRHGETVWNLAGKQQGHLDSDLTELGVRQAQAIADTLAGERFDALYSSNLGRAVRTAEIIAKAIGLPVLTEPRLRERHLGIAQGLSMTEFRGKYPEVHERFCERDPDYILPGGESARQRNERSVACLKDLAGRHPGGRVVIVAHGGTLASIFRQVLGLDQVVPRRFSLFNASLNRFSVIDGQWRLDSWGDTHHLRGLPALDDS